MGASAGGIEALTAVLAGLRKDFPAPILVVHHLSPTGRSVLPDILARASRLEVGHAHTGEVLQGGRVYVAPPDQHLVVHDARIRLSRGPRENHHRPAVDVLFRSVARVAGQGAIGVVLSGNLDDGTAGMLAIKQAGGVAIVQSPEDALYTGMPSSATANVTVDHVVPAERIGPLLHEILGSGTGLLRPERKPPMHETAHEKQPEADASPFVCPDCGATLFELKEGGLNRYRCRVGHAYSQESLYAAEDEKLEAALWVALRTVEEHANMSRRAAERTRASGLDHVAETYEQAARQDDERAAILRRILSVEGPP
jgi:two-component system chemotaxis response regulator CheB